MASAEVTKEPIEGLNTDTSTWDGIFNSFLLWAAKEPTTFLFYVLLFLTPFFLISAFLSYKLSQELEKQEKQMKAKKKVQQRKAKKED